MLCGYVSLRMGYRTSLIIENMENRNRFTKYPFYNCYNNSIIGYKLQQLN